MRERNKITEKDKWDLYSLFRSEEDYKKAVSEIKNKLKNFEKFREKEFTYQSFKEVLVLYYSLSEEIEKTAYYSMLYLSTDLNNQTANEIYSIYMNMATCVAEEVSFLIPKLQKIESSKINEWLSNEELKDYKIAILKILREKEHILSESEEKILSNYTPLYSSYENIFSMLSNADMRFGEINGKPLTNSTYSLFLENEDENTRKEAFSKFYKEFREHENTLSSLLISKVTQSFFIAKTRKYKNTLEMKLFSNNIDTKVYTNLLNTVNENISILNSYYDFRKSILKKEYLNHYDVYVPLTKEVKFENTFDEASEKVFKSLEIFGDEYVSVLKKGILEYRWVDKYENNGKRSGAFSAGSYRGNPYILINYKNESIRDMFTLAHEAGHSMHTYFSAKSNPFPCYDYSIFEAEVASTVNEQLLAHYLLSNETNTDKIRYIKLKQLDDFIATFFRQTMFAEFEYNIHNMAFNSEPIVKETLKENYMNLLKKYFGGSLKFSEESSLECFRIPHFYNPFYVYQYATGFTAALIISKNILENKEGTLRNYLDFIKVGGSKYPLDSMQVAGVNLLEKSTIQNTINTFKNRFEDVKNLF